MNEQEIKNFKKKQITKLSILVVSIIVLVGSVSYAFFAAGIGGAASTDIDATSEVSENSSFIPGEPINIHATLANFGENMGSLSGETTSSAKLIASSSVGSASLDYQVYFKIDTNDFEYTVDSNTPEMIITVTDPEGNELTAIDGLTPVTVTDALTSETIKGFDVTTFTGLIKIAEDYNISTTSSTDGTQQDWKVKLTFVNLDTLQTANEGKTFSGQLLLQSEKMFILNHQILQDNGGVTAIEANPTPNFATAATSDEGMFATADDYGTSYYYRGAVDNNWLYWADFYWRIVRINGNDSVKLIYSGSTAPDNATKIVMTGVGTQIGSGEFNKNIMIAKGVGYTYDAANTNSTIKNTIDTWYVTNIVKEGYDAIVEDTIYCNDRTNSRFESHYYYGAYWRNVSAKTPELSCPQQADSYTAEEVGKGNGLLNYPIGLLTTDEAVMAGSVYTINNYNFYLNTESNYWLLSPSTDPSPSVFIITTSGYVIGQPSYNINGIRPVLSLKSDLLFTGSGTWDDPYTKYE